MSIRTKLLLTFFAVAALIGLLGALAFYQSIERAEDVAKEEATAIAQTISLFVNDHLKDVSAMQSPAVRAELQRHVVRFKENQKRDIVIIDTHKRIVADAVSAEIGLIFGHDPGGEVDAVLKDGGIRFFTEVSPSHTDGIKQMVFPLGVPPSRRLGALVLEYTPLYRDILARTRENAQNYLLFYVWALGLALMAGHLISLHISRPLKEMQEAARKVAAGDLAVKVRREDDDELGDLAESFNAMTVSLKQARDDLMLSHEGLESEIAERSRAEEELRKAVTAIADEKAKSEAVIAAIADGISIQDKDFRVLYQNPYHRKMVGDHVGELCYRAYQHRDTVCEGCHLAVTFIDGKIHRREQSRETADGLRYYEIISSPVLNAAGEVIAGIELVREITDRKRAEEELKRHRGRLEDEVKVRTRELLQMNEDLVREVAERKQAEDSLRESEERLRKLSRQFQTVLNGIRDPLFQLSRDMVILWANLGDGADNGGSTQGRRCYERWHRRATPCDGCPAFRSFESGKAEGAQISGYEGRLFDERSFPVLDDDGRISTVVVVAVDITEKTNLQAEAMRAGHLASLGELAAGVAHEINNPINGVINYAQILAERFPVPSREADISGRIIHEGKRIAAIVQSLLSFARERKDEKVAVRIREVMAEAIQLSGALGRKDGITLELTIPDDLSAVKANSQQLQQVLLNLLSNSRYALNQRYPAGGENKKIVIGAENVIGPQGPMVRVSILDHGTGIPAELLHKVSQPFFTTKPAGSGTGLGLSISYGIIRDHRGSLSIDSEQGKYTRVVIDLPAGGDNGG